MALKRTKAMLACAVEGASFAYSRGTVRVLHSRPVPQPVHVNGVAAEAREHKEKRSVSDLDML